MDLSRVFVSSTGVTLVKSLMLNSSMRKLGKVFLDRKIKEKLNKESKHGLPPGMIADRGQMLHNMMTVVDRWMSDHRVEKGTMKGFLESFASMLHKKNKAVIDEFTRTFGFSTPRFITLSPTKLCNLKCVGCYAASAADCNFSLEFDTVDRIIREQKELWASHFTVISGGEPLLYKSQGKTLLDLVARHPDTFFLMYTNGTLIDRQTAQRMAELGNITPSVSVEGFEEQTDGRRGKGVHRQVVRALENLQAAGVLYGVSVTATSKNADIVLNPEFVDYYMNQYGVYYAWIFQYMPIGRSYELELMVPPEKRVAMFTRMRKLMYEDEIFLADFWNSATTSNGCVSAGRKGGYIYIDWHGNVMPCVFNPYTTDNIKDIYATGGNLNEALLSPFLTKIREWQDEYYDNGWLSGGCGNMLAPCPIKDHYETMRRIIDETGARPADESAKVALEDPLYYHGMCHYGRTVEALTNGIWEEEYLKTESSSGKKEAKSRVEEMV